MKSSEFVEAIVARRDDETGVRCGPARGKGPGMARWRLCAGQVALARIGGNYSVGMVRRARGFRVRPVWV